MNLAVQRQVNDQGEVISGRNASHQVASKILVHSVRHNTGKTNAVTFTYPLTVRVAGALQMTLQPVSSTFLCSPLTSGTWRTQGLSIPSCCLPTSSSVCHVFFALLLCLAMWFWPDLVNGRHLHTSAVCDEQVFVWSDCLLDLSTGFLVGNVVFEMGENNKVKIVNTEHVSTFH